MMPITIIIHDYSYEILYFSISSLISKFVAEILTEDNFYF